MALCEEYAAQAASSLVSGEVKLSLNENALTVIALFDMAEIPFARMKALTLADYAITIKVGNPAKPQDFMEEGDEDYVFSRMGSWCQPFYDDLCDAYNKAVLRALFVDSSPILTAAGDYRYTENGTTAKGETPVHVYENCIVALPPDCSARRVPLCFVNAMEKGDYELTLRLDTGESYTYARLGYDTTPFSDAVEKQIRTLYEKSLAAVKEIDPSLPTAQASRIARLMPEGAAAPMGQLASIAPSFAAALEEKMSDTRAAESYKAFKELCDPAQIYVGFRKIETAADGADTTPPDPYLLWLIAPSPDGQYAAVEFAEADTATFVYRMAVDFAGFTKQLNRALEAISFKREVIRLTDEELLKPENTDYFMAANRTAALRFIRASFAGRVIHSNGEIWRRKLTELWSGK